MKPVDKWLIFPMHIYELRPSEDSGRCKFLVENWKWIIVLGTKTHFRTTEGTPEQKRGLIHHILDHSTLRV
jgi:hypothetical protein